MARLTCRTFVWLKVLVLVLGRGYDRALMAYSVSCVLLQSVGNMYATRTESTLCKSKRNLTEHRHAVVWDAKYADQHHTKAIDLN